VEVGLPHRPQALCNAKSRTARCPKARRTI
jgi:hypothetical protein